MRINIKTKNQVKDKDVKGLYVIGYAFDNLISKRMILPTLEFLASKFGYKIL